jgi:hypothetical protein
MFIYVFVQNFTFLRPLVHQAIVKNYNIRAGAILSFYILQNITLNYAYSSNTHYYIPLHDCVWLSVALPSYRVILSQEAPNYCL